MKKLILLCAMFMSLMNVQAQTCSSPVLLDGLNGSFSARDSFNVQDRFFKFTATSPQQQIKLFIKGYTSTSNYYVKIYENDCANLGTKQLTVTPVVNVDSLTIIPDLWQGKEYLIEIGKISNNSVYVVHSLSVNNAISISSFTCPAGGPCPVTGTCELVCNGGFENISQPVTFYSQLAYAYNWTDANTGTTDLFSTSSSAGQYSVPCNVSGYHLPISTTCTTNNNYIALLNTIDPVTGSQQAEYAETKLSSPMVAGKSYIVSFYVSKGQNLTAILDKISIYLTPGQINQTSPPNGPLLSNTPSMTYTNSSVLNNTSGWTKINFCYYSSSGGENYLTIGRPNTSTLAQGIFPTSFTCYNANTSYPLDYWNYTLIDEVSVRAFELGSSTQSVNVCGTVTLNPTYNCSVPSFSLINYVWTGSVSNPFIMSPTATVNATTNYFVTATGYGDDGTSCSATGSALVNSATLTPISLSASSNTVCPGAAVTITATGSAATCTFNPGNINSNTPTFNPTSPTTYTAAGTTTNGCSLTNTITIYTYTSTISASASPASICTGFSSTLTGSNGSGFTWQPGPLSGTSVVVSPTVTTTYTVTGTTSNGCVKTNTVTLTVNNPSAMSISPAISNSICLNSSINLVASGASTYTWQPGNVVSSNNNVTPTVNSTYTVYGTNSFGCIGSQTTSVFIYSLPTVNCSSSSTAVCPGVSATLSASGASTYTWLPSTVASSMVISPTITTSYTVIGTSAVGCTNNCVVTQSVHPANLFTVTATPSVVCGTTGGGPSTLVATPSSPSTYTWLPSNTASYSLAVTSTSVSSPVYTVISTSSLGCIGSNTIQVKVSDGFADISALPSNICQTGTLNLSLFATPYPSGTFSINGVPSSTLFSQTPGTYTVTYTNTSVLLCNQTATAAIQVFSVPVTPTVTGTSTFVCGGQSLTLTANPVGGAPSYIWPSTTFTGNPLIITPSVSNSYSCMAVNGACSVTSANEFIFTATPLSCDCFQNCNSSLNATITSSPASNTVYCVNYNLYINGNITLSNSDLKISPGVSITVLPSSTLTISGCHLYACDQMWQGISVQQGGKLIINSGTRTSFIEDAVVAVDMPATSSYTSTANILTIDNVTFNRNVISIRINDYLTSQTTYPFSIQNCLFTSRTLTFSTLSYQNTSTIKNGASGNTSPLQTPYISNTLTPTTLKAPNSTIYPNYGIYLNNVGYTNSNGNVWYNLAVGNSTNSANFNCFDNLRVDIGANNSNLQVTNNVFQNGQRYGHLSVSGGQGIIANSITSSSTSPQNNQMLIQSVIGTTTLGNQFYEKTAAADITGYINTIIENNAVYSYANDYSLFNNSNTIGNHGFNVTTNRYFAITMQKNKLYNIKNAMLINLDNGPYSVGTQSGNGRLVGNVTVSTNTVNRHPTTAVAGEYVNICAYLNDPYATAATTLIFGGSSANVFSSNTFTNVHNGISAANVGFSAVTTASNTISMVNEPSTYGSPVQNGVQYNQLHLANVNQNKINGPSSYTNAIYAVQTSLNNTLTVKCNTTTNTFYGLNFNGNQALTNVQDNIMQTHTYGMSLTNTATIGQQGTSSNPPLNQWTGTYTASAGTYKTMNYNVYSSAQNSKMYAAWGATTTIDPDGSSYVVSTPSTVPWDNYYHLVSDPNSTIKDYTVAYTLGCRLSGGGGGGGGGRLMANPEIDYSSRIGLMEMLVGDTSYNAGISPATNFIGRNVVYRQLNGNLIDTQGSNVLTTFYNNSQNSSLQRFFDIETDLMHGDYFNAHAKASSLDLNNNVEANYLSFYNLYISAKMATFNSSDSAALLNLCNLCPYTQGGVVYQARALYNMLFTGFGKFKDNCAEGNANRLYESKVLDNSNIKVELKTKLYPNPNNGEFTIEAKNLKENKRIEVLIFDVLGKLIYRESKMMIENVTALKPDLTNGAYVVKIKLPDGTFDIHRLIIEK